MNSIEPTQNTSRPTSGTESGTAKVSQAGTVQNDQPARQNAGKQTAGQHLPDQQTGTRGHSDPAVSLSASLGKLDLGATVKGTVTGLDSNQQLLLKTPQGTFVLDTSQMKTAVDLPANSQLELKISAVDHVIEAQLVTKDNVKLNPPVRLNLILVGIDGKDALQSPSLQGNAPKVTSYGPGTPVPQAPQSGIINPVPGDSIAAVTSIRSASLHVPHPPAATPAPSSLVPPPTGAPADKSSLWSLINQQSASSLVITPNAQVANTKTGTAGLPISTLPAIPSNASTYQAASQNIPNASPLATGSLLTATVTRLAPDVPAGILAAINPASGNGQASSTEVPSLTFRVSTAPSPSTTGTIPESGAVRLTATVVDKLPPNSVLPTQATSTLSGTAPAPTPAPTSAQFLATNVGVFQLTESQRLPVGQTIHLELVPAQTGKTPQASASPAASGSTQVAATVAATPVPVTQTEARQPLTNYLESWSTIDDIISTLSGFNPGLAAVVQNKVAGPVHNLGAKAAFLLQILGLKNSGETWLGGKTAEALLKAGRGDLINRLTDDFNRVASLGRDSSPADWKPALLPFNDGRETHALPMLVRQMRDQSEDANKRNNRDGDQDKSDATRFVIDISLSKLGPVQMDGMIKSRHFDLIMRTERTMTPHMKTEISNIFSNALANNRFAGDVVFQTGKPFPLSAAAFIAEPTNSSGGVYA